MITNRLKSSSFKRISKSFLKTRCFSGNEHHLQVYNDVINAEEEKLIMEFLNPVLSKRRYEGNHWDDVITKYKEVDLANYKIPQDVGIVFEKIRSLISKELSFKNDFLTPHVIDLAKDGRIGGHVDSVKFSGDWICGLSLLSSRVMRLSLDWQDTPESSIRCTVKKSELPMVKDEQSNSSAYPKTIDLFLPKYSLYIMKGVWRYHYSHSVLGHKDCEEAASSPEEQSEKNQAIAFDRRVSIIFRDALIE